MISLQQKFTPHSLCFGCGPCNEHGLKLESFATSEGLTAHWQADDHHQAFEGIVNGGVFYLD